MRKLSIMLMAALVFTSFPPQVSLPSAEAANLFEILFPRSTERRRAREREARLREQRRRALLEGTKIKVSGPKYYTYKAEPHRVMALGKLQSAFAKIGETNEKERIRQREEIAQKALEQEQERQKLKRNLVIEAALRGLDVAQMGEVPLLDLASIPPRVEPSEQPAALDDATFSMIDHRALLSDVRVMATKKMGAAIAGFYAENPDPLWLDGQGLPNEAARKVALMFADADQYGLQAGDYALATEPVADDAAASLAFELSMTAAALQYASDARHGVTNPDKISGYHDFPQNKADHDKVLRQMAVASDRVAYLLGAHPADPAFAALKRELAELAPKDSSEPAPITIAPGTFIKPGQINTELANIIELARRRADETIKTDHAQVLASDHSIGEYTPEVVEFVRDMQRSLKLTPDGIIGKNTIRRLVGEKKDTAESKRQKVRLAMERLRWHPDHLGTRHVLINQPAYRVALNDGGREVISMKAVVGKSTNQTNFFHDTIEYVEFNPYWGVPRSILVNEMLPKLRQNGGYLDQLGYEITNGRGQQIASASVDWFDVGSNFPYDVRQPPGPRNALGRLKIMFPNRHSIYMHDTPAKSLFSRRKRAYSHGCVRLERPQEMAAAVLGTSIADIKSEISTGINGKRNLKSKLPVYVSYYTAWPGADGKVLYYSDVYKRDAYLTKALSAERKMRAAAING